MSNIHAYKPEHDEKAVCFVCKRQDYIKRIFKIKPHIFDLCVPCWERLKKVVNE